MPELPDLQVISSNLNTIFKNKKLMKITIAKKAKANVDKEVIKKTLEGSKVISIMRNGKEIFFEFDNNHSLSLHLMREGKLFIVPEDAKHELIEFEFNDKDYLIMGDFMAQAKISLDPIISDVPDPFSPEFTINYLKNSINTKKRSTIKGFLIDPKNILGIGNAYADEILWETKLSPSTKCGNIPETVIEVLYEKIIFVLKKSIDKIKEIEPDIISGEIRDFMNVHNKDKKVSSTGYEIHVDKIGGKTTYFTDEQVLYE